MQTKHMTKRRKKTKALLNYNFHYIKTINKTSSKLNMIQEVMFRYQKCRSYIQKQLTLLRVQHVQKKVTKISVV